MTTNENKPDTEKFRQDVLSIVASIPCGKVITYGDAALLSGWRNHARLVGRILHGASNALPCHRVVNASGRTAPHWEQQRHLLLAEGVTFKSNGCVNMKRHHWRFDEI